MKTTSLNDNPIAFARVFPSKTAYTPEGDNVFYDTPDLFVPENIVEAYVSCVFSWDKPRAEMLAKEWGKRMITHLGGPAYDDPGETFTPGMFLRDGYIMTSRGCPRKCDFCVVPKREGNIRTLPIHDGNRILDSNLFACPRAHIESVFEMLHRQKGKVGLHGGIDAKLAKDWHFDLIGGLRKKLERIYVAADDPSKTEAAFNCIRELHVKSGLAIGQIRCFVLCGFDPSDTPEKAEARCIEVLEHGAVPFASYFRAPGDIKGIRPPEWNKFVARWAWMPGMFARIKREDPALYARAKEKIT